MNVDANVRTNHAVFEAIARKVGTMENYMQALRETLRAKGVTFHEYAVPYWSDSLRFEMRDGRYGTCRGLGPGIKPNDLLLAAWDSHIYVYRILAITYSSATYGEAAVEYLPSASIEAVGNGDGKNLPSPSLFD